MDFSNFHRTGLVIQHRQRFHIEGLCHVLKLFSNTGWLALSTCSWQYKGGVRKAEAVGVTIVQLVLPYQETSSVHRITGRHQLSVHSMLAVSNLVRFAEK